MLLAIKTIQKTVHRQIGFKFHGKRHIPLTATDADKRHRRQTVWKLRAKEAHDHIKEAWPGSAWIVELITTTTKRNGKWSIARQLFITSVRTAPEALLSLIRKRWSIENEWHWPRDTQLGEDPYPYTNRMGAPVFSLLRTIVMHCSGAAGIARFAEACVS